MSGFGDIVKLVVVLSLVAILSGFFVMKIGMVGEDTVPVPNLEGKDIVTALQMASRLELILQISNQDFDPVAPRNQVIHQDPPPETPIRKHRLVQVAISRGPKDVTLLDLSESSLRRSETLLKKSGLKMSQIFWVYSDNYAKDGVVAQSPPPGTRVNRDTGVDLLVSKGRYPDYLMVPDFSGLNLDQATGRMQSVALKIKKINYRRSQGTVPGIVLGQSPVFGTKVEKNSFVELTVSEGAGSEPDHSKTFTLLYYKVPVLPKPGKVVIQVENNDGEKEVYNRVRRSEEEISLLVELNGRTTAKIYVDGELKEVKHLQN